jgi:cupin fold WbuC family metalloprotein
MIKINHELLAEVAAKARVSARKRSNHNFHKSYSDRTQRLLNAANPGTYVRPHKHKNPDKLEVFILLRGRVVILEFGDDGRVSDYVLLDAQKGNVGVEIPPQAWHTFISLEEDSVLYEVKEGPYSEQDDKKFAPWAPEEGAPEAGSFMQKILVELKLS